jgi:hypothetical protein
MVSGNPGGCKPACGWSGNWPARWRGRVRQGRWEDWWLAIAATPFGLVLVVVGVILRLCEWSWGKPVGSMGNRGVLLTGGQVLVTRRRNYVRPRSWQAPTFRGRTRVTCRGETETAYRPVPLFGR